MKKYFIFGIVVLVIVLLMVVFYLSVENAYTALGQVECCDCRDVGEEAEMSSCCACKYNIFEKLEIINNNK